MKQSFQFTNSSSSFDATLTAIVRVRYFLSIISLSLFYNQIKLSFRIISTYFFPPTPSGIQWMNTAFGVEFEIQIVECSLTKKKQGKCKWHNYWMHANYRHNSRICKRRYPSDEMKNVMNEYLSLGHTDVLPPNEKWRKKTQTHVDCSSHFYFVCVYVQFLFTGWIGWMERRPCHDCLQCASCVGIVISVISFRKPCNWHALSFNVKSLQNMIKMWYHWI